MSQQGSQPRTGEMAEREEAKALQKQTKSKQLALRRQVRHR